MGKGIGDGARGYQVVGDNVTEGKRDWHEAIDWYRPITSDEGVFDGADEQSEVFSRLEREEGQKLSPGHGQPKYSTRQPPYALLHGLNIWPSRPIAFRSVYETYIKAMLDLGTTVVRAMGWALELEDPETFVQATRESFWVMRAIGYPPLPSATTTTTTTTERPSTSESGASDSGSDGDGGVSCGAHTDYGCLTLLLADDTKGALQVQSRQNPNEWINADPISGAFVVNIGDMMELWTGGRWQSTRHRVVHRGEGMRVSVPFFFEPDFEARVGNLLEGKEKVGEVVYGEHLRRKVGGNFYGGGKAE